VVVVAVTPGDAALSDNRYGDGTRVSWSSMASIIEDYALIGDTQSAALVGRDGAIDWACFPRFDSGACFAALLGNRENGRWLIAPREVPRAIRRRYRPDSLVVETEITTSTGVVRLIDFMPIRDERPDIIRIVEGIDGTVDMHVDLVVRFDMGRVTPWVRKREDALVMTAGPDALCLRGDVEVHGEELATVGDFTVRAGERRSMILTWFPSHRELPPTLDPSDSLAETDGWWRTWSAKCKYEGPWREAVVTSLRVLKALTYGPTGGIVAAPTTSLPEWPGGARNWDYRYCWLRDATLTLYALMLGGYEGEAGAWREWLLRAAAGDPLGVQIMYGVAGERRLTEYEAPWLTGFENSRPVRIGNAAHEQLQLDVFGEVMDALFQARRLGVFPDPWSWSLEKTLLEFLEQRWKEPDHGIGEVRGPKRHFTHSKVMAWVAFDRAIKSVEIFGLDGPLEHWRAVRDEIHAQVCAHGYDRNRQTFTQSYGAPELDASLLLISLVGFLPASDPRIATTVQAIERELLIDGLVRRYRTDVSGAVDGLQPGEGVFLPCSFWLADVYVQLDRRDEARILFERLLGLRNDVGLLSEEYEPRSKRLLGNFPQAFSHLSLVNTAYNLTVHPDRPASHRAEEPSTARST
jgi:GH15 family glucan-1,4-alpha-glucosidase